MPNPVRPQKLPWIDIIKGVAIIGVVLNHQGAYIPLYLFKYTIYCVPLFFLLAGFNSYNSVDRREDASLGGRVRSLYKFLFFYLVASVVYMLFKEWPLLLNAADAATRKVFFQHLATAILHFSAQDVLYFCPIYIQVALFGGFFHFLINKLDTGTAGRICLLGFGILLYEITSALRNVVTFPDFVLAARNLFGATYLFLYFLGCLMAHAATRLMKHRKILFGVGFLLLLAMALSIDKTLGNPPNKYGMLYALAIFLVLMAIPFRGTSLPEKAVMLMGRYSIHIFMYHLLIMAILSPVLPPLPVFFCALALPLPLGIVLNKVAARLLPKRNSFRQRDSSSTKK